MTTARLTPLCARFIHQPDQPPRGPFDTQGTWCHAPATHATICNPKDTFKDGFAAYNIGHFYCQEHAPADAIKLPDNYQY